MVPGVPCVVVLVICASMSISVFALDCKSYRDSYNLYHMSKECKWGSFCCGTCTSRDCCFDLSRKLTERAQERCDDNLASWGNMDSDDKFHREFRDSSYVVMITGIVGSILFLLLLVCCCVCPCCCIYKMCRRPQPVVATTTHTTVVTSAPQQYPQQPMSVPGQPQPYQATQYPPYQPMPVQPGYGTQPMATSPYKGQAFTPGPPPPYQEAIGPAYPPTQPMPYSQAAYNPGQPAYPLHPPTYPQPNAPSSHADFLAQPAYNPDYVAPPTTG
ncbi:PREDICTED: protein shisa-5-like [Poecilia mexicana]|uniref:Protein shisa-5 n=1 Tax=Poecilia mexicana TaxID=48701 RepID=A0A3B3YV93_9TELE|nr:PREDICTED: protein shisa-5-like [Poecilia mexicana]